MFSKACEYGIKAIVYIAKKSDLPSNVSLKDTAEAINSPEAFTAKILQQLVKSDLVESQKGPNGGFKMSAKQLKTVNLSHVVNAIDGDTIYKGCGLGLKACDANHPCPVHEEFKIVRESLRTMLENSKIEDLAHRLDEGLTVLKR